MGKKITAIATLAIIAAFGSCILNNLPALILGFCLIVWIWFSASHLSSKTQSSLCGWVYAIAHFVAIGILGAILRENFSAITTGYINTFISFFTALMVWLYSAEK